MEYSEFSEKAMEELKLIQESFIERFKIDRYSNWFYNQSTELIRLYNDIEEVFFKYIPVGSYSTKSKTWMWAWSDLDSVEQSKNETLLIKRYGLKENFEKLSNGYFKGDEYYGWEFTSIALQLLGGMGGYKVNSDHLEKYFLIIEKIDTDEVKKIEEQLIDCDIHGKIRSAFICQHLNKRIKTGFEEAFPTDRGMQLEEDDDFQAWCDECEKVRIKYDGWTDESMKFASIKLVCERCYFEIKEFNLNE